MLASCPQCKKPIVIPEPGIHTCPRCQARIWIHPADSGKEDRVLIDPETMRKNMAPARTRIAEDMDELEMAEPGSYKPPWERIGELGFSARLGATWKQVSLQPTRFFNRLKVDAPLRGVLFYGWLFTTLGIVSWAAHRLIFLPTLIEASEKAAAATPGSLPVEEIRGFIMLVMIGAPILSLVNLMVNVFSFHLVLMALGRREGGLRGTYRVVMYSSSPMVLMALPLFGDFIAFVWSMSLSVIGLMQVHRLSNAMALLAVLLPPVAFYTLVLLISRLSSFSSAATFLLP